jgi:endonuclease/exonuclease/phosphatase family metal-dependent hydrolase
VKKILKYLFLIVLVPALAFAAFLAWTTLVEYNPDKVERLDKKVALQQQPLNLDTVNLLSWNIGYAGLGSEMDFFYDDGNRTRSTRERVRQHFNNIKQFIGGNDSIDFWFIQEIDIDSKRSWSINEVEEVSALLDDNYKVVFAKNYDVPFVPVPFTDPLGHAKSGILSASKYPFSEATRHAYPLIAPWPQRLFLLHRCYTLLRFPLERGNDLVIINTHNTAYIYDSTLRMKELNILRAKMMDEYAKGNYVITGGDWNQNPPGFKPAGNFNGQHFVQAPLELAATAFPKGWMIAYDDKAPTNRQNNKPFVKGENGTTVIDFFILSPNIGLLKVKNLDLNFRDSDHNPVFAKVRLK